jgi:hypothetical protein
MSTIWIYEKGDVLRVFDSEAEARAWLAWNDPPGIAREHNIGLPRPAWSADRYGVAKATETRPGLRVVK